MARIEIDKDKVVRLYEKFGTIADVSISMSCSKARVKETLLERGIEIKQHARSKWYKDPFRLNKEFRGGRQDVR